LESVELLDDTFGASELSFLADWSSPREDDCEIVNPAEGLSVDMPSLPSSSDARAADAKTSNGLKLGLSEVEAGWGCLLSPWSGAVLVGECAGSEGSSG
jgi:hypothetical protein